MGMTKWLGLLTVSFLTLSTYLALIAIDRFHVNEEQLLSATNDLVPNNEVWTESGSGIFRYNDGDLVLRNNTNGNHKVFQIVAVAPSTYLRLEFEASSDLLDTSGAEYWYGASGVIKAINRQGQITKVSYVAKLYTPGSPKFYSHVELTDENTESVAVYFQLLEASGDFRVKNPVLSSLEESTLYRIIRYLIAGFWICAGLCLLVFLLHTVPIYQSVVSILCLLYTSPSPRDRTRSRMPSSA